MKDMEQRARKQAFREFSRKKARLLVEFGKIAADELAADFSLPVAKVRRKRVFRKKSSIWIYGAQMPAQRYKLRKSGGNAVAFPQGTAQEARIVKTPFGTRVFAPESAPLPAWAAASKPFALPRSKIRFRKLAVAPPKNFRQKYTELFRAFVDSAVGNG